MTVKFTTLQIQKKKTTKRSKRRKEKGNNIKMPTAAIYFIEKESQF
jgi:hypothetical protein